MSLILPSCFVQEFRLKNPYMPRILGPSSLRLKYLDPLGDKSDSNVWGMTSRERMAKSVNATAPRIGS